MGCVSFLLLFLLSVLSFPIEGTGHPPSPGHWKPGGKSFPPRNRIIPNCPPSPLVLPNYTEHPSCSPFHCNQLDSVRFPFNNESYPECGLMTVRGCTGEELPWIQLEPGGRHFQVKNIFDNDSIVVHNFWSTHRGYERPGCELLQNLTHSVSLKLAPTLTELTLFKCFRSLNISLNTDYTYNGCHDDFVIHYNRPNNSAPFPPPKCSIIQYPVDKSSDMADLPALLISDITLQLHIPRHSEKCHDRRDQCPDDEKEWCPSVTVASVKAASKEEIEESLNHKSPAEIDESLNHKLPAGSPKPSKLVLGFGIGGGSIAFLIAILVICFFIRRALKRQYVATVVSSNTSSDPSSRQGLEMMGAYYGIPIFPYSELEEATNYFDPDEEIGNGGFGVVYHGQLRDGREVAVKRLFESNCKQVARFMNEIEILTSLRHPNLVSLYGCTSRHSSELLLVYEYIPNGTVADHLHGKRADSGLLTWPIRLSIAIETASALCYLHASDVIHRDVKTNNILLDNSFRVKVADFGLSRLFPLDATHVSTAPQGTPGYVDPEYHQCYQLTEKSDVYSFGVVLVELLSSLAAVDLNRHRHEINLSNYAINKIRQCAFQELMDPSLGFDTDVEVNRMTILVAELAFRCLQPDKEGRPSMDEVLEVLKEIESDKHGPSQPLPPSPDCDEVVLLKSVQSTPSPPDYMVVEWQSRSSLVVRSV